MQLGELQSQIERFEARNTAIIAISVDTPEASLAMIERLGLSFALASDPDQRIVRASGVQNPDTKELALHAVYLVDRDGEVVYRKVARRRPTANELIDAIDAFQGNYPQTDRVQIRSRIAVAYPTNNFQALLELVTVNRLPASVDAEQVAEVYTQLKTASSDDALITFKRMVENHPNASQPDLLDVAAWLTHKLYLQGNLQALKAGRDLSRRLDRVAQLEAAYAQATDDASRDALLQNVSKARAGLSLVRGTIRQNADAWRLRTVKASLRSLREVARAGSLGR